ncbi:MULTISPECIES: helix-turn-helix domain-containing protein [unclassified Burkholderia]|uniref:helix-turn-helix transcriptional regulator n=1 Tax=unclassified Burkholderia TaxID=2613784 RepID=UPI000F5888B9|nr:MULTISPECIES: helix-turn-helix domain-containing protein [unclassified Burkholderia]RQR30158.1 helix-turn-helix domain-containing protein [Burkholderia sp. Bp9142]RQR50040.1 helix-turn-helix domain-containing protein [Burkholderia sp. Bp9140]
MRSNDHDKHQSWAELGERFMLLTRGRMAYLGFLGHPEARRFGALTVYVSIDNPFRIRIGHGSWQTAHMIVVAPETRHEIVSGDRLIAALLIEAETVAFEDLPAWLRPCSDTREFDAQIRRLRDAFMSLRGKGNDVAGMKDDFDRHFFGHPLQPRKLDQRIMSVAALIGADPGTLSSADDCARRACLSVSRFLHLFKENMGTTLRRYRAWKRARNFLAHLNASSNLTDIAFDIGYPDSSHFSHTVRWYWGLTPQNMVAGSRGLAVSDHRAD